MKPFKQSRMIGALLMAAHLAVGASLAQQREDKQPPAASASNPYLAPAGLSPELLAAHIEKLRAKPKSVQARPGFADALIDAADRILAAKAGDELNTAALLAKFEALAQQASQGNQAASDKLAEMAAELRNDPRAPVAREARFHRLQARMDAVGNTPQEAQELLAELKAYFTSQRPAERHLRLISGTVRLINALKDDAAAIAAYQEFGELFSKSDDRKVARYGGEIIEAAKQMQSRREPVTLEGTTVDGSKFDIASHRGKPVLIYFWISSDARTKEDLPRLKTAYEKYHPKGFEVVGISLDTDRAALQKFIDEHEIPWPNLVSAEGESAVKHPLAKQFNVQALPAAFLLDREGKLVAKDIRIDALGDVIEKHMSTQ